MENQTEELWLKDVSPSDKGTGLILLSSSYEDENMKWYYDILINSEIYGSIKKGFIADITYLDCFQKAISIKAIAFKWIPNFISNIQTVIQSASSCGGSLCVKRCAGYGCICIGGECK